MSFQILSLSGGGYLGLYSAAVLAELEDRAGRPLRECFDLIAGTSIGGIIALGLAKGVPAATIRDRIEAEGPSIFASKLPKEGPLSAIRFAASVPRASYSSDPLRRVISDIVGESSLMGDLQTPAIVPAVNLTNGQPKVFKTPHHPRLEYDWKLKLCDVGIATSAAPTFFPVAEVGHERFADGGLFANSPDLLAVHEATYFLGQRDADLRTLSIGTTTARYSFSHRRGRAYGIWGWARNARLVNVIIASQQQLTDFMMRHRFEENYLRIDALQSKEQERDLGVDKASAHATSTILGLAASSAREFGSHPLLARLLTHTPAPIRFYHGPQASRRA
jgi:uncharacterized protein